MKIKFLVKDNKLKSAEPKVKVIIQLVINGCPQWEPMTSLKMIFIKAVILITSLIFPGIFFSSFRHLFPLKSVKVTDFIVRIYNNIHTYKFVNVYKSQTNLDMLMGDGLMNFVLSLRLFPLLSKRLGIWFKILSFLNIWIKLNSWNFIWLNFNNIDFV